MRRHFLILTFIAVVHGSQHLFSVHDDVLAFPQYDIIFSDSFISDSDAESRLAVVASRPAPTPHATGQAGKQQQQDEAQNRAELSNWPKPHAHGNEGSKAAGSSGEHIDTYEVMLLNNHEYLCAIPLVEIAPRNETADAVARAEEEKELSRASVRGWELLKDMQGTCLYFDSGWWSYQFCYNAQVKQFHQLPPQKGLPTYPPAEDPTTASYILGRVRSSSSAPHRDGANREAQGEISDGKGGSVSTELQAKGEMRYLVQKLGAGTMCDLTGRERRIEIQFHCHPQSSDRIGWIKEVTTCSYLMVIYTPRLCNDIAFLPPRSNKGHPITCQEILHADQVEAWKARKAAEAERQLFKSSAGKAAGKAAKAEKQEPAATTDESHNNRNHAPPPRIIVGGIQLGGKKLVGDEGRRISSGAVIGGGLGNAGVRIDVVARGEAKAQGGATHQLSPDELQRLHVDRDTVERLQRDLQDVAGDKGWRLEVVDAPDGQRHLRGIIDAEGQGQGEGEGEGEGEMLAIRRYEPDARREHHQAAKAAEPGKRGDDKAARVVGGGPGAGHGGGGGGGGGGGENKNDQAGRMLINNEEEEEEEDGADGVVDDGTEEEYITNEL